MNNHGLSYAEGFALASDNKIFDHAWAVDYSGSAIEVTIPDAEPVAYFGIVIVDPKMGRAQTPLAKLAYDVGSGNATMPAALSPLELESREAGFCG
jgi:hypothetical protein